MDHPQAPPAPGPVVLALEDVNKSFGAVAALRGARLELRGGEAHALVGENGAGKSTLVKILAGVHGPDTGRVLLDGEPVTLDNPAAARAAGIAVIYHEPTPFPDLSAPENIFPGAPGVPRPPGRGKHLLGPPAAERGSADRPQAAHRPLPGAVRAARRHA